VRGKIVAAVLVGARDVRQCVECPSFNSHTFRAGARDRSSLQYFGYSRVILRLVNEGSLAIPRDTDHGDIRGNLRHRGLRSSAQN
jgi:hypothetical protein